MAKRGKSSNIGKTTSAPEEKEFAGSGVEGQKDADEGTDAPMNDIPEDSGEGIDRFDAICDAIGRLAPEDFTADGKPRVESLEAASGIAEISAEERDTAWELYQENNEATEEEPVEEEPVEEEPVEEEPVEEEPVEEAPVEEEPVEEEPVEEEPVEEEPVAPQPSKPITIEDVIRQQRARGVKI